MTSLAGAAARRAAAARRPHRCPSCGRRATTGPDAARLTAELKVEWLLRPHSPGNPTAAVALARFCAHCARRGPVTDLACITCGDGPLVPSPLSSAAAPAGAARSDPAAPPASSPDALAGDGDGALQAWLAGRGWIPVPPTGWRCPTCARRC